MALFDFLKNFREGSKERKLLKAIKRVSDKNQNSENRNAAIDYLTQKGSDEAIAGLIGRFNFNFDKTIVDKEEKERVSDILLEFGEKSVPQLKEYIQKSYSIAWPIKILAKLINHDELVDFLIGMLSTEELLFDEKELEKRIDLLGHIAEFKSDKITEKVITLLSNDDDRVVLKAIEIIEKQDDQKAREPLLNILTNENIPNRIKARIIDAFVKLSWDVRGFRNKVEALLPKGHYLNREGQIRIRGQH